MSISKTSLDYYTTHGVMSTPGLYSALLDNLPTSLPVLCQVVQGLLMHPFTTRLYDVELTSIARKEVNIRPVAEMLRRIAALDDGPLSQARQPQDRLVGNCCDHALLLCALLRHQGVPARVRVGFAAYFGPRLNHDHWVTEVYRPQ